MLPPPFSLRPRKKKNTDAEYTQFLEMMKNTTLNILAYELFTGAPKYVRFFKTMLSTKEEPKVNEIAELSTKCSSIVKKDIQLPKKLKDPRSCNIPFDFGEKGTFRALCDLGSGVSLMPKKLAEWMNLIAEMKYTSVKLLLADPSVIRPQRIIEDVCVGVRGVILSCDFIVIELDVDKEVPLILGRPFLATGDAWIGVKDKVVVFQVNGERVVLNMDKVMKQPAELM